ncbi:MAG: LamG domain-containing protein [Verrucomicrobia bacterium]|nr:LamG domain-containing protein [Verrucomicrobiota bacterium]
MRTKLTSRVVAAKHLIVAAILPLAYAAAGADYQSTVLGNAPKAYYRLNDDTTRTMIHTNIGSLGASGNATNDLLSYKQGGVFGFDPTGVVHPFPGAIIGDKNRSAFFDYTTRATIPFTPAINPPNTQPFTIETWFYPATDQNNVGMAPINNRYTVGANRQGWTYFQRKVNADSTGGDPVGWNFRMFSGVGGGSPLDTTAVVPFEVGKWVHVVTVYDPTSDTEATVMMYINGVMAVSNHMSGQPLYQPCTGDHDTVTESPAGQPGMSIGCYNNCNTGLNPYFGGADEFAWYSNALSPAQILSHYQNGTNANRATPYDVLVKSHNPVVYLRLDEIAPSEATAVNLGDVRSAGLATHRSEVRYPAAGALAGRTDDGAAAYHNRNGNSTTTMPYLAENNPNAGTPFTFEAWLRPMRDQQGGQSPVNNRWPKLGHRTGWVIFQRFPNASYAAVPGINNEGHGWNFRMYDGVSGSGQDVTTAVDYKIGQWQHLVVTWEPQFQNGDVGANGNDQWSGILTAYVDGVAVASNTAALYAANTNPPEDLGVPADLAIGSYNAASTLGNNPFEGDVDEVAIYNGYVLTPDQILAHYQAGVSSNLGTNYETLVMTSAFVSPQAQRASLPKTYLRFNDPSFQPAANSGTLGSSADGNLVLTTNVAAGPQSPAYAGFEASNASLPLDGLKQWASFNNPSGLNFSGQITVEAWVKPDATQGDPARILSHGTPTISDYILTTPGDGHAPPDGSVTNSPEVFLRIEGGVNYVVGSTVTIYTNNLEIGSNTYTASFPIPGGDLGGGNWVHLAGTYDGSKWRLYRNGLEVASSTSAVGALPVLNGDWAIGSTGNGWANNYAGGVDEVAIYDTALSKTTIATHYLMGKAGTTALTITKSGGNVNIAWPAGSILQQATAVGGPYTDVAGPPANPLTVPASGTKYYRWRL